MRGLDVTPELSEEPVYTVRDWPDLPPSGCLIAVEAG